MGSAPSDNLCAQQITNFMQRSEELLRLKNDAKSRGDTELIKRYDQALIQIEEESSALLQAMGAYSTHIRRVLH